MVLNTSKENCPTVLNEFLEYVAKISAKSIHLSSSIPDKHTKTGSKFSEKLLKHASSFLWLHLRERIPTIIRRGWIWVPTRSRRSGNTRPPCRKVHLEVWKDRKDEFGKGQVRIKFRETAERSSRVCKARERERESREEIDTERWIWYWYFPLY